MGRPVADVSITGYGDIRRALRQLPDDSAVELREGMKTAAAIISRDASRRVVSYVASHQTKRPRRSDGRAAASIRPVSSGNTIYIAAGGGRVPYYGWLDFGGVLKPTGRRKNKQTRAFYKRGRFLYPAIDANRPEVIKQAEHAINSAIKKVGLD